MRRAQALIVGAGLVLAAASACGQQLWRTEPDSLLAKMRGGFATPSGLVVSFGMTRTVMVDGQVVAHSVLRLDDLRTMDPQAARAQVQGAAPILQIGNGNVASGLTGSVLPVLVLQNTESNRRLQTTTVIDATTTNVVGMVQGMRLQEALSAAAALGR